jgi:hypothetical protein
MRINPSRLIGVLYLGLALFGLSACSTFESRAKKRPEIFSSLDAATKSRLETGAIDIGDTPDMVYIALGTPDEKREQVTAAGSTYTWIYSDYWHEYQGTRLVGYRRDVVYNAATKSYVSTAVPDYQPIYAPRVEDRLRITFQNGRVTVVEQAQAGKAPEPAVK